MDEMISNNLLHVQNFIAKSRLGCSSTIQPYLLQGAGRISRQAPYHALYVEGVDSAEGWLSGWRVVGLSDTVSGALLLVCLLISAPICIQFP